MTSALVTGTITWIIVQLREAQQKCQVSVLESSTGVVGEEHERGICIKNDVNLYRFDLDRFWEFISLCNYEI